MQLWLCRTHYVDKVVLKLMKSSCLCLLGADTKGVCQYIHLARKVFIIRHKRAISQESWGEVQSSCGYFSGVERRGQTYKGQGYLSGTERRVDQGKTSRVIKKNLQLQGWVGNSVIWSSLDITGQQRPEEPGGQHWFCMHHRYKSVGRQMLHLPKEGQIVKWLFQNLDCFSKNKANKNKNKKIKTIFLPMDQSVPGFSELSLTGSRDELRDSEGRFLRNAERICLKSFCFSCQCLPLADSSLSPWTQMVGLSFPGAWSFPLNHEG